jgi:hypothetical protein
MIKIVAKNAEMANVHFEVTASNIASARVKMQMDVEDWIKSVFEDSEYAFQMRSLSMVGLIDWLAYNGFDVSIYNL